MRCPLRNFESFLQFIICCLPTFVQLINKITEMKSKKTKFLWAGLALAAVVYGFSVQSQDSGTDPLLLENVEALADGEYEQGVVCIGYGSLDCPNGEKVDWIVEQCR